MKIIKIFFAGWIILYLTGCTTLRTTACEAVGGHAYVNLGGFQRCGKIYKDAGKVCHSSDECEGECHLPSDWDPADGKETVGSCENYDTPDDSRCLPIELKHHRGSCIEE